MTAQAPTALIPPSDHLTASDRMRRIMNGGFRASQWRSGVTQSAESDIAIHYSMVRSYDAKRLYYRPELKLVRADPTSRVVEILEVDGQSLPIHRPLYPDSIMRGVKPIVGYILVYAGRPVDSPYATQLLAAPGQVLTGRVPMTLFLAHATAMESSEEAAVGAVRDWLASTWRRHQQICVP